jgi:hypothetical protein
LPVIHKILQTTQGLQPKIILYHGIICLPEDQNNPKSVQNGHNR